jgi:hypothetical protein
MSLRFKEGVKMKWLVPQLILGINAVEEEFTHQGLDTIITAITNGVHKENSLHYIGRAVDFRTKHAAGIMKGMAARIEAMLHPLGFDVLFESQGTENEHLHVEWDPKDPLEVKPEEGKQV